jgi:hypothetical protein
LVLGAVYYLDFAGFFFMTLWAAKRGGPGAPPRSRRLAGHEMICAGRAIGMAPIAWR